VQTKFELTLLLKNEEIEAPCLATVAASRTSYLNPQTREVMRNFAQRVEAAVKMQAPQFVVCLANMGDF
jgi:vancomycin permeability regulator SanA